MTSFVSLIVVTMIASSTTDPMFVNFDLSLGMTFTGYGAGFSCNTLPRDTMALVRPDRVHPRMMACPFTPSNVTTCPTDNTTCMEREWMCVLPPYSICDGTSQCLTDECDCGEDIPVLYCRDNAGCVTLDKVCNGFLDCPHGEDEWACQDVEIMEDVLGP